MLSRQVSNSSSIFFYYTAAQRCAAFKSIPLGGGSIISEVGLVARGTVRVRTKIAKIVQSQMFSDF